MSAVSFKNQQDFPLDNENKKTFVRKMEITQKLQGELSHKSIFRILDITGKKDIYIDILNNIL